MVEALKKILYAIILFSLLLTGCVSNQNTILKKIEKKIDKMKGYETILDIKIDVEGITSNYKMKETYIDGENPIVEIIYPEESSSITLEYLDDKIIINNASIEQSITLKKFKNVDKMFLVKDIFDNIKKFKLIEEKDIDGEKFYSFESPIEVKDKYTKTKKVLISKKQLHPFSLEILDFDDNSRIIISYEKFKFLP